MPTPARTSDGAHDRATVDHRPLSYRLGDGGHQLSRSARARRTARLVERLRVCEPEERRALLHRLVETNVGVAEAVASRYRGRGIADEDLYQVAYEALTRAVDRFDVDSGHDLLTYAVPTIRGEVMRHFRDAGWTIRPPRRIQEAQQQIRACRERLAQEWGREPTDGELRRHLDLDDTVVDEALSALGCFTPVSLDQPLDPDGDLSLGDVAVPTGVGAADADAELRGRVEARLALRPLVLRLDERERRLLALRFFEDLTQAEIAREMGVTQVQVSRLLSRLLAELRAALDPPGDDLPGTTGPRQRTGLRLVPSPTA